MEIELHLRQRSVNERKVRATRVTAQEPLRRAQPWRIPARNSCLSDRIPYEFLIAGALMRRSPQDHFG
jgi:hypothetical protein